jgi:hypothetical protein
MADPNNLRQLLDSYGGVPTPFGRLPANFFERAGNAMAPNADGAANALGAPVDALAYLFRRAGMPMQQPAYGSQNIRGMIENGPGNALNFLQRHPFYQLYLQETGQQQPQNALTGPDRPPRTIQAGGP